MWEMKEEISFSLRKSKLERCEAHKEISGTYGSAHSNWDDNCVIVLKHMPEIQCGWLPFFYN